MKTFSPRLVLAALGAAALAVGAQAAQLGLPQNASPEIVVYGIPEDEAALTGFVRDIGAETGTDQLARWRGAICPEVIGMRDEFNNYVHETIRSVADLAGARWSDRGCQHNVLVVMTDDPSTFISDMRDDRRDLFASLTARERETMASSSDAVSMWSRVETRGGDGRLMQSGEAGYNARGSGTDQLPYRRISGAQASRIARSTRSDLDFRAIIIDLRQLDGQTMQQLSAFAAMMALGEFDVSNPISPQRTVLNLFHNAETAPADLSDWDLAYLRALYSTNAGRSADNQRSAMIRHIRRDLAGQ